MFRVIAVLVLLFTISGAKQSAFAQASLDLRGGSTYPGGSLIPGYDSATCDGSIEGAIRYNSASSCAEFCDGSAWTCPNSSGSGNTTPPTNCPSIGETCDDGSIYAGLSPDGQVKMYTTPADAASTYTWNDGTTNYTDLSMANCTDASPGTASSCQTGEANTAILIAEDSDSGVGGVQPHQAAEYCDDLTAHGYSDWYLPAQDELNVLYTNKNTGDLNGTFNESGSFPAGWYWSSSEFNNGNARLQRFSDGLQSDDGKNAGFAVRCVRR